MQKSNQGLTMMEIVIVIVMVGILAAFALPNYGRSIQKSDERAAVANLAAIKAGVRMWLANSNNTQINNWGNLATINNELGLAVIDNKLNYACFSANNRCSATHPGAGWSVEFDDTLTTIHCGGGTCPTCTGAGCGV